MTESDLNRRIKAAAKARGVFWDRHEDKARRGRTDAFASHAPTRRHAWVELKVARSATERPVYGDGQLAWAVDAADHGEPCRTIVGAPRGCAVWDTAAVGRAVIFETEWPEPLAIVATAGEALEAALGST